MTRMTRWTRSIAGLLLATALLVPTGAALAAPSTHLTDHRVFVGGTVRNDDAVVVMHLTHATATGLGADVQVWLPPDVEFLDPPTLISTTFQLSLAADDSRLTATVELVDRRTGRPAGQAVVDATLAPDGEPFVSELRTSRTNTHVRRTETIQVADTSGSVTVPGLSGAVELALDGVNATIVDLEEFTNAPTRLVGHYRTTGMELWFAVDDMLVGITGESDESISWVDAAVILPDGTILNGEHDGARIDHRGIAATVPISPTAPGLNPTGGQVVVRANAVRGERATHVDVIEGIRYETTVQEFRAVGTVEVSLDDGTSLRLDLADAIGAYREARVNYRSVAR